MFIPLSEIIKSQFVKSRDFRLPSWWNMQNYVPLFSIKNLKTKIMKIKGLYGMMAVCASFMLFSCSNSEDDIFTLGNDEPDVPSTSSVLRITDVNADMEVISRAAITPENAWNDNDNIGITIYKSNVVGALMTSESKNIKWMFSEGNWTSTTTTYLPTGTNGYVTAYYPWVSGADPTAISIDNNKDWMYAKLSDNRHVSYENPSTNLTMLHTNTRINVFIGRSLYTGTGHITSISVKSPKMADSAILNSTTGVVTNHHRIASITKDVDLTIDAGTIETQLLVLDDSFIPTDDTNHDVEVSAVIDGQKWSTKVNTNFRPGKTCNLYLLIKEAD